MIPMEENLISKKELLQRYGISYGALYRWKRMGLIPEQWFVKKSTSTGQETYFDEKTICERIEQILGARDTRSLEELAASLNQPKSVEPHLIIETSYESRSYRTGDIRSIRLEGEKVIDLTEMIAEKLQSILQGGTTDE